jgi:hypothetical protein
MAKKPKLCQIVAVVSGMKTANQAGLTKAHHIKVELITGLTRKYEPKDAEGDPLAPDIKRVQTTVPDVLKTISDEMIRTLDAVRTLDEGNTRARADVVVQGKTILSAVPVGHLLYLESRLDDLGTFIDGLPTLDPAEEWRPSESPGIYRTDPTQSYRMAKVFKNHPVAPATEKHPAQVQVYQVDEVIGTFTSVKSSGAIPQATKSAMAQRVKQLRDAVKMAREEANATEVDQYNEGESILNFVFGSAIAP